jgi:hypothetical protein
VREKEKGIRRYRGDMGIKHMESVPERYFVDIPLSPFLVEKRS